METETHLFRLFDSHNLNLERKTQRIRDRFRRESFICSYFFNERMLAVWKMARQAKCV